jgi:hypothetical protein
MKMAPSSVMIIACASVVLIAAAGASALQSGNLAYLSPVVELPNLATQGAPFGRYILCTEWCLLQLQQR